MSRTIWFTLRQAVLMGLAALAYFGVRGLTEANVADANKHALQVLNFERFFGLDLELGLQRVVGQSEWAVDAANWIYIWAHWPVVAGTLLYLAIARRTEYFTLRNAMFISGAIGLVIFATYAVAPPRLFAPEYVDTVTERSLSYRVLQPPRLVNKYAAVPSLHFGWNLLVGLSWFQLSKKRVFATAGVLMPLAMAFAVVATANHWTVDVFAGAAVALSGLGLERVRQRYVAGEPIVWHLRSKSQRQEATIGRSVLATFGPVEDRETSDARETQGAESTKDESDLAHHSLDFTADLTKR